MSVSVSFARSPELSAAFAAVQRHFQQVVVPLWHGPGWNAALQLPYEALQAGPLDTTEAAPLEHLDARQSADSTDSANRLSPAGPLADVALTQPPQPLPPQRYRAMACARQLYLFANLIDTPHAPLARPRAAALFDSLQRHFHDPQHGGWFYSIDAQGQPLDQRKDLYTHAFVIFACAHYRNRLGQVAQADPADQEAHVGQTGHVGEANPATHADAVAATRVAAVLEQAVNVVLQRFAVGSGDDDDSGLYEACLAQDWSALASGPLQNPLMHLAEAFLATLALGPNPRVEAALLRLVAAMQRRFVDQQHGLVLEKPLGAPNNWFEPGHQFEWLYLLETSPLLRGCALHASLQRAWIFAEQHGVVDGAVLARLDVQGQVQDASQRIWAHAEYLRALTLRPQGEAQVQRQLAALQARFLHAGGWHECLAADGRLERRDLPSTTPYHLATCYAGLAAYLA